MKLKELSEDQIIEALKEFLPPDAYNEDAALVPLSKEPLPERIIMNVDAATNRDDWLPGQTLQDLGFKTLMASASDLAAKGAQFVAAQSSINISVDHTIEDLIKLVTGMYEACQLLEGAYLGGDLGTVTQGFVMSVTTIGYLENQARYLSRRGMRDGDVIWVSGEFGWTGYGFSKLLSHAELDSRIKPKVLKKLYRPEARITLGTKLAKQDGITSCIDCSDGLARTLWILARENEARLVIDEIPEPTELRSLVSDRELLKYALHGGEEFELVFTARPEREERIIEIARELGIKLTPIGVVRNVGEIKGGIVDSKLPIPIKEKGWDAIQRFDSSSPK